MRDSPPDESEQSAGTGQRVPALCVYTPRSAPPLPLHWPINTIGGPCTQRLLLLWQNACMEQNQFNDAPPGSEPRQDGLDKQPIKTGHKALKYGTIAFLSGFAVSFALSIMGDSGFVVFLGLLCMLICLVGFIVWAVGMVQRVRFNKQSHHPIPLTTGEKVSLVGSIFMAFGILLVNGDSAAEGITFGRAIGIAGFVAGAGGAIWHLLSPRPTQNQREDM